MSNGTLKDPEDFFAETRMTFGDHLEELRLHLWRTVAGFGVALILSFFIGKAAVDFITAPVKQQLREFYNRRVEKTMRDLQDDPNLKRINEPTAFTKVYFRRDQLQAALKGEAGDDIDKVKRPILHGEENKTDERSTWDKLLGRSGDKDKPKDDEEVIEQKDLVPLWMSHGEPLKETGLLQEATRIVGDFDTMSTLNVQEAFMVWFKVCIVCGIIIGSPWIFWQIWMFVAAGLYPHEKRLVHVYLPVSLGLFLSGRPRLRVPRHPARHRGAVVVQRMAGIQAGLAAERMAQFRHLHAADFRRFVPDAAGHAVHGSPGHRERRFVPQQTALRLDGHGRVRRHHHALRRMP